MPTEAEIAWAAGLFEGEGSFHDRGKTSGGASLSTADRDVHERFRRIVGVGWACMDNKPVELGRKPLYRWEVSRVEDVRKLIALFMPWLGERRADRARALLKRMEVCRGREAARTHCPHGHAYTAENTIHRRCGRRGCRACHRERDRRRTKEAKNDA